MDNSSPITPQMREMYKQECTRGITLFQKSLEEYQKSQIPAQKEEFKDVMDQALKIIHETVVQCLSQEKQQEELELEKDYHSFLDNPSNANLKKLSGDLQHLQRGL